MGGKMALIRSLAGLLSRPEIGEVFELSIDGNVLWSDPLKMLYYDGYDEKKWGFCGNYIQGVQTRRFKLFPAERCSNLDQVIKILRQHGKIPEGQWRVPFAEKYSMRNPKEMFGISDPSWIDEYGDAHFPCLTIQQSLFHRADDIRRQGEGWLWLVEITG